MKKPKKPTAAVPFAQLLGRARAEERENDEDQEDEGLKAKRAEWEEKAEDEPERKQKAEESDEDYVKRMEEMDDAEEKAEGEDDDESAKGEESDERAEEEEDDERAEDKDKEARATRRAERARCARIIAFGMTNKCEHQAAAFAFDTGMSAQAAISAMRGAMRDGKRAGSLASRMGGIDVPNAGPGAPGAGEPRNAQSATAALAAEVIKAGQRRRGEIQ